MMELKENERSTKRFKHQSYNQMLKDVHLPSALDRSQFDNDIEDNDSHFHQAIDHWRGLNLSPAFIKFANKADGLSVSMALLIHHWQEIVELWLSVLDSADDEALKALLDLLQKLSHDVRTTLSPSYMDLISRLVTFLHKRISPDVITALLASFSALFKHVLIPTGDLQLVERTWSCFKETLPKCNPDVQRAAAEVWGTTLRKIKLLNRPTIIELLIKDMDNIDAACAWIFVFACKSVAQSLHIATASILRPLLDRHLSCENEEHTYTLLRRALTALVHHVKSPDQFAPVADLILEYFERSSRDENQLERILPIVAVVCSVRQGSRLSKSQLSDIASIYMSLIYSPALHAHVLKLSVSLLLAGETSFWMESGRKIIDYSWEQDLDLAIELCGSLSDMNWGGWKMIAAPQMLRHTWTSLEKSRSKMLRLLASLCKDRKLDGVDAVWKEKMEKWVARHLMMADWERTEKDVCELRDISALSTMLPAISQMFNQIVQTTLQTEHPSEDFEATPANSSVILGVCLQGIAGRPLPEILTSESVVVDICAKWGWSQSVMSGVESFVNSSSQNIPSTPLESIYPHLKESLLSHSRILRLSVLRLLSSSAVISTPIEKEILNRCLQGEGASIDVQGVRERVLRIGSVCQVIPDENESAADIAVRWILAQLKVNLQPLWSPASHALATLSERFGDLVWKLVFGHLQRLYQTDGRSDGPPTWISAESERDIDDIQEEERSWKDPSAHKMRVTVARWSNENAHMQDLIKIQSADDRLDPTSYEAQLLAVLSECCPLAEKHNRELIPLFLTFVDPETPSKLARRKLTQWLTLFSKFTNPKALHSTDKLQTLYVTLLSHPDRSLQKLALASILTYKSPHLIPYRDTLNALLDDTRWRDELTGLDISQIEDEDRKEYVDVLVRLLFGIMLEKRGRSRGGDRRATVITALGGCRDEELDVIVELMLGPIRRYTSVRASGEYGVCSVSNGLSEKHQIGYLNLLGDVLKNLGSRLASYWPALLGGTLDLLANAQTQIDSRKNDGEVFGSDDGDGEDLEDPITPLRMIRTVRRLGLKRFAEFFKCSVPFDFSPYMKEAFRTIISPRLPSLDQENTQAPSALLEVFFVWTLHPEFTRFFADFDTRVLPKVYDCLIATNIKPAVISRIFDIVDGILAQAVTNEIVSETVLKPYVSRLLENLATLVGRTKDVASASNPFGQRQIFILSEISHYLTDSSQASVLLGLFSPLLRRPSKIVPEKVKTDMIKIVSNLLPLVPELSVSESTAHTKAYTLLSQLLQSLRARPARLALISAFQQFSALDSSLLPLTDLLTSLNAYSIKRVEEPDFDRRMDAFAKLNEGLRLTLSPPQWLPILHNMLYFIQDPTELAVRTNASFALRSFIDVASQSGDKQCETLSLKVLYPGLKNGLRSKNEMVRGEVLGVIAYMVTQCPNIGTLQEMRILLADGDEEANFFNNINHVQIHRRTRALRRLAEHCNGGCLRSSTLAEVFVPLVGNYIGSTDFIDHHLVNEAIITTGSMASRLAWGAYSALVQQYLRQIRQKDTSERVYVRAVVTILDNFHFQMDDTITDNEPEDVVDEETEAEPVKDKTTSRIADAVNSRLIPALLQHLEKRDENEDAIRIPISVGIINVAKHLPEQARESQISKLLTVLCQVFRSKSQDTRDLARETLCRIAINLGPTYLPRIICELRAALLRGPHLHVLAVVTHALLVHVTGSGHAETFSVLNDCVEDVAHVSAEVIFGQSGKDTQSEGFKTKMREVRSSSSKGLDCFGIVAKHITPVKVSSLLHPIRSIFQETETLKVLQQVDDVLRRIAGGLNSNIHLVPSELLSLCYTLVSQNARFLQDVPRIKRPKKDQGSAIVQLKRPASTSSDHYANNSFRFVAFGLDLFNTAHRRNRFDFQDPKLIARLESMVMVIGNTLYSQHNPVIILGLKAAAAIVKCPLKSVEKALPVIVTQMISIIQETGSTESEVVQTAFRSLATILRDHPSAQMKERDLIFLLELVSPDLEEPSRQASVFTILRAIISRKFVVPEIYDLMDKVSEIMVTNQSSQVQELCRGALLQFLLDYPQGKKRLRNQMTFLAKNLSYTYESGRKSVMELLSALVSKLESGLVQEYGDLVFVALVMVITNDESAKCREMAAELIKGLYLRLDDGHRKTLLSHLHTWTSQESKPSLTRVSCQVYGLIVEVQQQHSEFFVDTLLHDLNLILLRSTVVEANVDEAEEATTVSLDWQVPYHALLVISKVVAVFPVFTTKENAVDWTAVVAHLLYPHAWVRTASCRLVGTLFTAVPPGAPRDSLSGDASSLFSLSWTEDIAKQLCLQLKSEYLDENLSLQIVKNLFYLGKCFSALPFPSDQPPDGNEATADNNDEDEEDEDIEREEATGSQGSHPLRWLFSKLSFQARSAYISRRSKSSGPSNWSQQPSSILRWFAAMSTHLDSTVLEVFLVHILSPVYRILDDDTIHDHLIDDLKATAIDLQDLVQAKVGPTKFANVYNTIRQGILSVRRERKTARTLQFVTHPEAAAKKRIQRNVLKKAGRKRKDTMFADGKGRLKRRRRE